MGKSIIKGCPLSPGKNAKKSGVNFYRIPAKDINLRRKWIRAIAILRNESDWLPKSKDTRICSQHFEPKCFTTDKERTKKRCYLAKDAVPKIPKYLDEAETHDGDESSDDNTINDEEEIEELLEAIKYKELIKENARLKVICKNRFSIINKLRKQNSRLRNKVEMLSKRNAGCSYVKQNTPLTNIELSN